MRHKGVDIAGGTDMYQTIQIESTRPIAAPRVELRLIGGFELRIDSRTVEVQPAVRRLTALVALSPRGLSRDFAAYQLWPDTSEERARANLRSTIWRLHQLEAEVVVASTTHLHLADDIWLDTREAIPDADAAPPLPRPFESVMMDLLPDWYDEWLSVERERFRQLWLASLEQHARAALGAGDTAAAIQFALAALSGDGARESAHRLVVQAHLAEGNQSEAERERRRFRGCLDRVGA